MEHLGHLEFLNTARFIDLNEEYPKSFPEWFELDKFKDGQTFARNNSFSVYYSEMISLYLFFSTQMGAMPLIYTGKSDTIEKALVRYYSTVTRVREWYEGDIEDFKSKLHTNLRAVRFMHKKVSSEMANMPLELLQKINCRNKVGDLDLLNPWTRWSDSSNSRIVTLQNDSILHNKENEELPAWKFIGQLDTSLTLFAFMGLIILYPEKFGVHNMTQKEADGFIHFWRTIGHFLGVDDEYNVCKGSLGEVRERMNDALEFLFKPYISRAGEDWEHLSRAMAGGMQILLKTVTFESSFLYLCWVIDLKLCPHLYKTINWKHHFWYRLARFLMSYLFQVSFFKRILNGYIKRVIVNNKIS